jgi:hypothetical protein
MVKGIFVHHTDSIYDDSPAGHYQFPRQYLSRVSPCIGDWIIYYEPSKVRETRGYFAVAKVADVVPDPRPGIRPRTGQRATTTRSGRLSGKDRKPASSISNCRSAS